MTESSRRPSPSFERALELAGNALAAEPAGLVTDFDGTLSPVVADPSLARLVDGAAAALEALADRLAVVAIVTGRSARDVRRMTGLERVLVAGNHGVEWLAPGDDAPAPVAGSDEIEARLEDALAMVRARDGVFVERKGMSATVHYRGAADPRAAREAILRAVARRGASTIQVREGRMSVELRPTGLGDKGTAARDLVQRHELRGVVVMGDDLTDLDMFRAVAELRDVGRLSAAVIGVGGSDREVPAEVTAAADVTLADPAEAAALLGALRARLTGG